MPAMFTIVRHLHYVTCYSFYKQQWAVYVRVGSNLTFTRVGYCDEKPNVRSYDNAQ